MQSRKKSQRATGARVSREDAKGAEGAEGQDVTDALARELLGVCMSTLGRYGVGAHRIAELAGAAIASDGEIPTASEMFQDTDRLGDLANQWTESPRYVDASGHPRVLPISGRSPSFASLVQRHFAGRPIEEILELGCRTRVLERIGTDRVAQFGGCVMFTGNPVLMLAHAILSVRWFLSTTLANASPPVPSFKILPDRRACTAVSEEDLPEFINVMRQPIISLVEMGNRWLAARPAVRRGKGKNKKIKMGVHAYVFRDSE